ncbi:MAG: peptide chain release factor N(5)-glutamine methyltransferase [Xanthomonadales bacterium]|nr:peptide chain release factor N(5)-glutamine methyltransferase [Xanthomonadales bacterium]
MTIKALQQCAQSKLAPDPSARLEAEILLCHALEVSRSFLFANPELEVPLKRRADFMHLLQRRMQGEPIAYLVGKRAFWTLDLKVTPDVLIPRPETERLVELALEKIPPGSNWRIADLGTGSGAIALAIASERPSCQVHATDISEPAFTLACENARLHGLARVHFHCGSWLQPLSGQFHLIVSNPPYVDQNDPHMQQGDCRFEPALALSPGIDGMSAIREIVKESLHKLHAGGWLLVEHGYEQAQGVRSILRQAGFVFVSTQQDLAGLDRVCIGQLPKTKTDQHPADLLVKAPV